MREQRRLAAIVAADVVGYSRLIGRDESGTVSRLRRVRTGRLQPVLARRGGRIVKLTGDGALIEFASAVEALSAAIEFQQAMMESEADRPEAERLVFRVGVHLGDVIVDGDDLYGDGVNIAARLEAAALAGGIVVSGVMHDFAAGRVAATFEDLGRLALKNIERPVQAYAVRWQSNEWPLAAAVAAQPTSAAPTLSDTPLPLPDKPSIAVLPFQNMSDDPEQEYFADGIAEDVLTTLSKIRELLVIARNSSFAFRGQAKDIREIGRILGARYVLEGSVRKAGGRVRLTAQLIDSTDGSHLWAERFDGELHDVFDLQDRITQEIVAALEVQLAFGEQARIWRKRFGSPLVYEHFLKARNLYLKFSRPTHAQARDEFERALSISSGFAPAHYMLGLTLADQVRFSWNTDASYAAALDCASRALEADPGYGEAYSVIGYVRTFQRRHEEAIAAGERAVALCPSGADSYHLAGMFHGYAGEFRTAVRYAEHAQRLNPMEFSVSKADEARARFHLHELATARDIARHVLATRPRWLSAQTVLVAALWNLGSKEEARTLGQELHRRHPSFSARRWGTTLPYKRREDLDAIVDPLTLAGLPA
ncbi:MAG: adenylate/guanylate cyclase domain-containing protein [Reyranellaceae bacterium]